MHKFLVIFALFVLPFTLEATIKNPHPVKKINAWFNSEKERSERGYHRFATLSTVDTDGYPSSRIIEIVGMSQKNGILFFTHRSTQKAAHLFLNPQAALNIWLPKTLRQISINGETKEIPSRIAEKSWNRMPRYMKLTFMASEHEGVLTSPTILQERKEKLNDTYKGDIPMPDTFVGYRLIPEKVIFYEIKPRQFPEKELSILEGDKWCIYPLEP